MAYDTREPDDDLLAADEYAPLILELVPFDDSPYELDTVAMFDDHDDPIIEDIDLDIAPELELAEPTPWHGSPASAGA